MRRTFRTTVDTEEDPNKISASFTIAPPPRTNSTINSLASRLEKSLDLEPSAVSATINVPLIHNKNPNTSSSLEISDKLKKTDQPPPKPAVLPRSIFDLENASSTRLAERLRQEAKRCDAIAISDGTTSTSNTEINEMLPPPSPAHHTIFGERRSWRLRSELTNKVTNYLTKLLFWRK